MSKDKDCDNCTNKKRDIKYLTLKIKDDARAYPLPLPTHLQGYIPRTQRTMSGAMLISKGAEYKLHEHLYNYLMSHFKNIVDTTWQPLEWDGTCHGTTKSGERCKRSVSEGSFYCSSHAEV